MIVRGARHWCTANVELSTELEQQCCNSVTFMNSGLMGRWWTEVFVPSKYFFYAPLCWAFEWAAYRDMCDKSNGFKKCSICCAKLKKAFYIQSNGHLFPRSLYFKSLIIFTVGFFLPPSGFEKCHHFQQMQVKRAVFVMPEMRKYRECSENFSPFQDIEEGVYVSVSAFSRQIFHLVLQVMFIKEFPNISRDHLHWRSSLTIVFGCIQLFSFWVSVATGQCLSNHWYSRPQLIVVVCLVFILLSEASRKRPPAHSNRVAIGCLWNLTQKPQLVLVSFEINKTRDPIKSVRAVRLGTSWRTVSVTWYKQHWWHLKTRHCLLYRKQD